MVLSGSLLAGGVPPSPPPPPPQAVVISVKKQIMSQSLMGELFDRCWRDAMQREPVKWKPATICWLPHF
jgi:hypothetical protein